MVEVFGDLWREPADAICITTNGFVKANGSAVMGRGCALEAATHHPNLPKILGAAIKKNGVTTQVLLDEHPALVAFPVKNASGIVLSDKRNLVQHMKRQFEPGQNAPGWALTADLGLIVRSAHALMALTDIHSWKRVLLPRPGCGAGELDWKIVKSILGNLLDDRFTVIARKKG